MVESVLDLSQFIGAFLGEGRFQVVSHHPFPIAYDIVDEHIEGVGDDVQHSVGQQRERVEEGVDYRIYDSHTKCKDTNKREENKIKTEFLDFAFPSFHNTELQRHRGFFEFCIPL